MLNYSRISEPLPPLFETPFELWFGHCVQDVALSQPTSTSLIDTVPDEAQLLRTWASVLISKPEDIFISSLVPLRLA
jgi:hypothetical protein